ncbi:hypothetical protein NKG94_21280 [Micromonospora sp. M12]
MEGRRATPVDRAGPRRDAVGALAEQRLSGPVSRSTTQLLWQWTGGLPQLAAALIDHGREVGSLVRDTDQWRWHALWRCRRRWPIYSTGSWTALAAPARTSWPRWPSVGPCRCPSWRRPGHRSWSPISNSWVWSAASRATIRSWYDCATRCSVPRCAAGCRRAAASGVRRPAGQHAAGRDPGAHAMASALWAVHAGEPVGSAELIRSANLCLYADPVASEQLARRAGSAVAEGRQRWRSPPPSSSRAAPPRRTRRWSGHTGRPRPPTIVAPR